MTTPYKKERKSKKEKQFLKKDRADVTRDCLALIQQIEFLSNERDCKVSTVIIQHLSSKTQYNI